MKGKTKKKMSLKSSNSNKDEEDYFHNNNYNNFINSPIISEKPQIPFHSQEFQNNNNLITQFDTSQQQDQNDNRYAESESSREDYLPLREEIFQNKASIIKGILLAFIFFSLIIYSVLYMLSPDQSANLIFEGTFSNSNISAIFDDKDNYFYKLDTIVTKKNEIILNISLNLYFNKTEKIGIIIKKISNNMNNNNNKNFIYNVDIVFKNNYAKKIGDEKNGYYNYDKYVINDFPFWLCLFKNKGEKIFNITSDYLSYFINIQKDSIIELL